VKKNHVIKTDLAYYCVICNLHFTKKSQLNKHNFIHTGEKAFKCYYPFCDKSYFNEGKLNLHIQKSHNLNHQINNINITNNDNNNNNQNTNNNNNKNNDLKDLNCVYLLSNNLSANISTCMDNNDLSKFPSYTANAVMTPPAINKEVIPSHYLDIMLSMNEQQHKNSEYEMHLKIKRIDKIKDVEDLKYINVLNNTSNINDNNINKRLNFGCSGLSRKRRKFSSEVFAEKKEKSFYKCPVHDCIKTYTSPYNLKVHMKTFHYKIQQFKCKVCEQHFKHKCSLNNHILKTNHLNSTEEAEKLCHKNPCQKDNFISAAVNLSIKTKNNQKEEYSDANFSAVDELIIAENLRCCGQKAAFDCDEELNSNLIFENEFKKDFFEAFKYEEKSFGDGEHIIEEEKFRFELNDYNNGGVNNNRDENLLFSINPNFFINNEN